MQYKVQVLYLVSFLLIIVSVKGQSGTVCLILNFKLNNFSRDNIETRIH